MEIAVQEKLIHWLIQPMAGLSNRLSEKGRDRGFLLCGILMFAIHFLDMLFRHISLSGWRFFYVFAFDCLMCACMAFFSLPTNIRPLSVDWRLALPGLGFGVLAFIAGVTKDTNHFAVALSALFVYPAIYFMWAQCDAQHIIKKLIRVCEYGFVLFLAIHMLCFPVTHRKYEGIFFNPNGLAFYLTVVFVCLMVDLLADEQNSVHTLFALVLFGLCTALMFYTNSRTGLFAVAIAAGAAFLLLLLSTGKSFGALLLRRWIPMVLVCALCLPAAVYLFRCKLPVYESYQLVAEELDLPNGLITVPEPDIPDFLGRDPMDVLLEIFFISRSKLDTADKTLTDYSTGRTLIWKAYLEHIEWTGHSYQDTFSFAGRAGTVGSRSTAHMTWLEHAWHFGWPAAVLFLLFNLLSGLKGIWVACQNPDERYLIMPCVIMLAFGVTASLASISSFSYMLATYCFLLQFPILVKRDVGMSKAV